MHRLQREYIACAAELPVLKGNLCFCLGSSVCRTLILDALLRDILGARSRIHNGKKFKPMGQAMLILSPQWIKKHTVTMKAARCERPSPP
ncbi:hypothetical protein SKAU_G00316640 [Synaphobranchus kaupii]|uniref:Uncharacterized protein n=1 Tax=Synaphobranchus kaupii TaxID=118154 RepID=A0A9Q1ILW7_SYNKA|nr:hypothetical protein SKAU_G00316640 [Synaphobranchus kaupii]